MGYRTGATELLMITCSIRRIVRVFTNTKQRSASPVREVTPVSGSHTFSCLFFLTISCLLTFGISVYLFMPTLQGRVFDPKAKRPHVFEKVNCQAPASPRLFVACSRWIFLKLHSCFLMLANIANVFPNLTIFCGQKCKKQ